MSTRIKFFEEDVRPEHRDRVLTAANEGLERYRARRRNFIISTASLGAAAAAAFMVKVKIIDGPPAIEGAALQANLLAEFDIVKELDFFEDLEDASAWQNS